MEETAARARRSPWLGYRPRSKGSVALLAVFLLVVVVTALLHLQPASFQGPMLITAWSVTGPDAIHQLHGLFNGVWVVLLYVPLLALLWRPAHRPAVAVFAALALLAGAVRVLVSPEIVADTGLAPVVIAVVLAAVLVALAPGVGSALRPTARPDRAMLGIAGAGAALAVAYAAWQLSYWARFSATDPHTVLGHWGLMAMMTLVAGVGIAMGALRLRGARLPTWLGALAIGYLAAASLAMPGQASALPWWAAVVALAIAAAAAVRYEQVAFAARGAPSSPRPAAPRAGPAVAGG